MSRAQSLREYTPDGRRNRERGRIEGAIFYFRNPPSPLNSLEARMRDPPFLIDLGGPYA